VANDWLLHHSFGSLRVFQNTGTQTVPTWTERMTFTANGNIGIGTTIPTSRLEILAQDGLAITGLQLYITLRDTNAGNARSIIQGANGNIHFFPNSFIGGSAPMTITTGTGNVGIGTSNPATKLEVVGTTRTTIDEVVTDGLSPPHHRNGGINNENHLDFRLMHPGRSDGIGATTTEL
jgi:hypothetical protein